MTPGCAGGVVDVRASVSQVPRRVREPRMLRAQHPPRLVVSLLRTVRLALLRSVLLQSVMCRQTDQRPRHGRWARSRAGNRGRPWNLLRVAFEHDPTLRVEPPGFMSGIRHQNNLRKGGCGNVAKLLHGVHRNVLRRRAACEKVRMLQAADACAARTRSEQRDPPQLRTTPPDPAMRALGKSPGVRRQRGS